jgi:hypothetical protein
MGDAFSVALSILMMPIWRRSQWRQGWSVAENKMPFVAALAMSEESQPIHLRLDRVSGFTSDAIEAWSVHWQCENGPQ